MRPARRSTRDPHHSTMPRHASQRHPSQPPAPWLHCLAALLTLACLAPQAAARPPGEQVRCDVTYGGETRSLWAAAIANPQAVYDVAPVAMGSYFLFRVVFQRKPARDAAIKVYVYADHDSGPAPLHVARYPYPPPTSQRQSFTGEHWVYEPVRDGELHYQCHLVNRASPRGPQP